MLLITNYYKEWDGKNKGKFVNLYVICTGEKKGTGPFPGKWRKKWENPLRIRPKTSKMWNATNLVPGGGVCCPVSADGTTAMG